MVKLVYTVTLMLALMVGRTQLAYATNESSYKLGFKSDLLSIADACQEIVKSAATATIHLHTSIRHILPVLSQVSS